jgi:hypothetical protein
MYQADWYLLDRGGRRHGPYDRDFIEQLAAGQELLANTPVWHPGLARWQPVGRVLQLPASVNIAGDPARPPAERTPGAAGLARPAATRGPASQPGAPRTARPRAARVATRIPPQTPAQLWQRVLAGAFDLLLVAIALQLVSRYAPISVPEWLDSPRFALLAWAALEGWMLASVGRTPGKALLGVTVRGKEGGRLDERRAWLRSGAVPLGLLLLSANPVLGFFALLALAFGLLRLRGGRPAWWDEVTGSEVEVAQLGQGRRLLAGLALGALVLAALALSRFVRG